MEKLLTAVFATISCYTLVKLHAAGELPALALMVGCLVAVFYGSHKLEA